MNAALKHLETLLQNAAAAPQPFPPTSRYNGAPTLTHVTPDGRSIAYVARRTVPPPDRFATLRMHTVEQRDRLDRLGARYLGDPEQWWRLADANGAIRPHDLVASPGARLRITLPEGIPGVGGD